MKRSLVVVACALALAATGCAPKAEKAEATAPKVFRFSYVSDIPTLDPQMGNSMPSATVAFHIFDGLTRMDNGAVKPGIAESWTVSDDGLVYVFKLRDAKWSDGQPIKAQEFEYGIRRLMDPAAASPYSFLGLLIENADAVNSGKMPVEKLGVRAVDDKTVELRLAYPADYFLGMLSMCQFCATRPDLVERYGKDFAATPDKNVYDGPFMVKEWAREDRMILVKNPNYWNADSIALDEIDILIVPDENTALAMFDAGDLRATRNPLDLAIEGAGFFEFESESSEPVYSRDGQFRIDAEGYLVNVQGLRPTQSIQIPADATEVAIAANGDVTAKLDGSAERMLLGTLELATFAAPDALVQVGDNRFKATEAAGAAAYGRPGDAGFGHLQSGYVEMANVDLVDEMTTLVLAQRSYQLNARVLQAADQILETINNLRR